MAGLTKEQRAEREAQKLAELQQQEGVDVAEDVEHLEAAEDVVEEVEVQDEKSPEEHSDDADDQSQENAIAYVTMVRDPDKYDAPHTAQVHPDEVVNYYSGGWVEDK
ncbi:TPA: hypothetical protein R4104_001490 [Enterobacter asburiae]|uniref:hypothetical protein n=1 Tax=Enterobacter asburiae TaxID=61645 RepID=UPI0026603994|nr:hypothetical protein [Enterobacter asburiae]HCM9127867.1 hypothetical protein [Enterobacter asburiae]HED1589922.1 hypothetical protein [Enterobacter asburiae]HED2713872.1 hypothetical protein [Enterobacter asburiae]HED3276630.1 hypothetical protein [Enterobacter asburiae]